MFPKKNVAPNKLCVYKKTNYTFIWNASRCNLELDRIRGELADVFLSTDISENLAGGGIWDS